MGRKRKRTCAHCHEKFSPDRYNYYHQIYCRKPGCRQASNCASSSKHRNKEENCTPEKRKAESRRVRRWQDAHPGYRNRQRRQKKRRKIIESYVLRDFARGGNSNEMEVLRDFAFRQRIELKGLVSHLFNVLRDDIGPVENRLYDIGLSVSGFVSETGVAELTSSGKDRCHEEPDFSFGRDPPRAERSFGRRPQTRA